MLCSRFTEQSDFTTKVRHETNAEMIKTELVKSLDLNTVFSGKAESSTSTKFGAALFAPTLGSKMATTAGKPVSGGYAWDRNEPLGRGSFGGVSKGFNLVSRGGL